ncbi:MAG: hypothetical protein SLAVMIC_00780 [uncultured marine phage]|uniref:DUF5672 domain-containing protein n=1 Tax=uncultured marine phage TaxID=707152 RepID=A0A8D9FSF0_9VIRU|nr:MAG: hypothetical protein SLAVMIC_00780 [uncultured marine phage]
MNNLIEKYISENKYEDSESNNYKDRIAVIIETRDVPHLKWVIENIKHHTGWEVMLFYYGNNVKDIKCLKVELPYKMDHQKYNDLLKDVSFWESFDQEYILIFQSDSFMLRDGLDEYLDYDYVGAPWNWANDPNFKDPRYKDLSIFKNGGNGGFSLRKKSSMLNIISKKYGEPSAEDKYVNEDMFFAKYIKEYPSLDKCKEFCVETMYSENPLAVHAIDRYLSNEQIEKILFK